MFLSTAVALLAIPLYLALGRGFGAQGIAAAGALAMSASALVMLVGLRLLHGGPALAPLAGTLLRGVAVALPAAAAGDWAAGLAQAPLVSCLQGGVVFMIIAIPSTWILGDEVTQEILRGLARRIARSRGA
jgi:hypothetical protein